MARVLVVANRKGGSGKTTSAVHIAAGLTGKGFRVLLVDADPQGHATLWLAGAGGHGENGNRECVGRAGLYRLLTGDDDPLSLVLPVHISCGSMDLLAGSAHLVGYESEGGGRRGEAHVMARRLAPYADEYDYIVIDTPPTMGLLMISALRAGDWVFIPLPMQFLALEGLEEMVRLLARINRAGNSRLRLRGVIPMFYDRRLKISAGIRRRVSLMLGRDIFTPAVRTSVKLAEAPGYGKTIFEYAPHSPVAEDWDTVVRAVCSMPGRANSRTAGKNKLLMEENGQ